MKFVIKNSLHVLCFSSLPTQAQKKSPKNSIDSYDEIFNSIRGHGSTPQTNKDPIDFQPFWH